MAKQLPGKDKEELRQALERERAVDRLKELMEPLKDVDIDEETIRKEVDAVRSKRYAAWKKKAGTAARRRCSNPVPMLSS